MWRAMVKGAGLAACGRIPGGARLYRRLTRDLLGTQATHVDKLARVWPEYARVWQERCGLELAGLRVWVHEGGWTPYPFLVNYLLTGRGGTVTNAEARVLDRYLSRAANGAAATALPAGRVAEERRRKVEALRFILSAHEAIAAVGGELHEDVDAGALPLPDGAADLCHSGGVLEHYPLERLDAFLGECHRILAPGGIASHVFDHRDHLHHADRRWPFLAHLALPRPLYRALCGHPLLYHDRLTPTEVAERFTRAGFEKVAVRRMILPERRYAEDEEALAGAPGLPRRLLARPFREISEIDLRTAAAHYLYRRV